MRKKKFSLNLVLSSFLSLGVWAQILTPTPLLAAPNYQDLDTSHWAYQSLQTLADKYGIQLGYPDGSFRGDETPNRYQIAVLLLKVLETLDNRSLNPEDTQLLETLKQEFAPELETRLQYLEDQVDLQIGVNEDLGRRLQNLQNRLPFRFFGSLALRYCGMTTQLDRPQDMLGDNLLGNILQLRAGFGINGQVFDQFDYQLRMLSTDNNSYNLSWFPFGGNHIPRGALSLDRYFIRYRPQRGQASDFQTEFSFGKAPDFFAETEALLDEDISFNGLDQAVRWQELAPGWKSLELGLAQKILLIEETKFTTGFWGAKAATEIEPIEGLHLRLGSSYLHYLGVDNLAAYNFAQGYQGAWSRRNRGAEEGDFSSEFQLANGFARLRYEVTPGFPVAVFGDYVRNLGAPDKNQGFFIGADLGARQKTGDWDFRYIYRHLEQDYNLSVLTDETMAGTDVAGHMLNVGTLLGQKTHLDFSLHIRNSLSDADKDLLYIFYTTIRQDF